MNTEDDLNETRQAMEQLLRERDLRAKAFDAKIAGLPHEARTDLWAQRRFWGEGTRLEDRINQWRALVADVGEVSDADARMAYVLR